MGGSRKIIVIGAGMGGLAAAIRLANAGADVSVFEAAGHVGGKMRACPSAAGPVDQGPTVLTLRAVFDDLFAAAGARLDDHLHLAPQPLLARHFWPDGSQLDLLADPAASADAIGRLAGAQAAAEFARFHAITDAMFRAFDAPMMSAPAPGAAGIATAALRAPAIWGALAPGRSLADFLRGSSATRACASCSGAMPPMSAGCPTRRLPSLP
jgi:1-hydroxycarotenoid 3,4-desaturase